MSRAAILEKLKSHNILPTPQRLEIAALLLAKPQHLSAEQIIDRLRENGSDISKATVYNTLNLFGEFGIIKVCEVDSERRIYDSRMDPHHHFYNVDTGEITDIDQNDIIVSRLPELPAGTRQEGVEVLIRISNRGD
jgi:Fur family iron response transcriptional regulator